MHRVGVATVLFLQQVREIVSELRLKANHTQDKRDPFGASIPEMHRQNH
jgi:hypothetical protein